MDEVCPPSTVLAAYNHYAGPKQIEIFEFNQHEGGETHQLVKQVSFLSEVWEDVDIPPTLNDSLSSTG